MLMLRATGHAACACMVNGKNRFKLSPKNFKIFWTPGIFPFPNALVTFTSSIMKWEEFALLHGRGDR